MNKPLLRSVRFVDDKHGWIAGYRGVFYTSDGGRTWQRQAVTVGSLTPKEGDLTVQFIGLIAWADQRSCVIRGERGIHVGYANDNQWNVKPFTTSELQRARSVVFVNQQRGWAIVPGSPGSILYGATNGRDWKREFKVSESLYGVFAISQGEVWAVGSECKATHTTDGGQTWSEIVIASGRQKDGILADFHAVTFISPQNGWICGLSGTILRTTDGGKQWIKQNTGFSKWTGFSAISFADENEGWAVGSSATIDSAEPPKERLEAIIIHTSDGGLHWERQDIQLSERLLDVQGRSNGKAWVVGEGGTVLRTVDHGKKWTQVRMP